MYFESNPKETTFSKEENVFWICMLDYGFYNKKSEGFFRKNTRTAGGDLNSCNGLFAKSTDKGVSGDTGRWIRIERHRLNRAGEIES